MQLSSRITDLLGGGSDGWGVFLKARRMIGDGVSVTELTIGEHDIRTAAGRSTSSNNSGKDKQPSL